MENFFKRFCLVKHERSAMEDTRELCTLIASVALECERYLDVIEALRPIFIQKIELTSVERKLRSIQ